MSKLPFELALALRYLRPKRTFVSVITLICIVGVMLGVSVLIIVIAVMTGFDNKFRDSLIGFQAHLKIEQRGSPMTNWTEVMGQVGKNPAIRGVAPFINTQVLIKSEPANGGATRTFGTIIRGVHPQLEDHVSRLTNSIVEGDARLTPRSLIVGVELAETFGIHPGDHMAVYSPAAFERLEAAWERARKEHREVDELPLAAEFKVRGLADLGLHDLNANVIITSLADAQELSGMGEAVQGLTIMLHDASEKNTLRLQEELQRQLGPDYGVSTWLLENRDFLNALATERNMMFYILFFIVIVAAFGIMSAQITFVVQKTREIGMLKALGATPRSIRMIFLFQSWVIGLLGVVSGLGLGILALHIRNGFLRFMNQAVGFNLLPSSIYQFRELPAEVVARDVAVICVVSLVICLLAGFLPALRASWLQPVEALRHE
ncbi:MAG TPA: ABC transporter permease [Candidatus Limnocylindria bacterium]|jgi:lipoprotein-releasing system permease protein|nr:ABC transporter permease [Candidatus Limnocylindria bacterium]